MFHVIHLAPIAFKSNHPFSDPEPVIDYTVNATGDPVNQVIYRTVPHTSAMKGAHYDPSVMSLRARLERGVDLKPVGYDQTDNDLNRIFHTAQRISSQIESNIKSRQTIVVDPKSVDNV